MLAVADTAFDLLVPELVLHGLGVRVVGLVLGLAAPVDAGAEDDVLADGGGVGDGARGVLGRVAELGPCLALGHARVDDLAAHDVADPPRCLHLLSGIVEAVLDDGPGAVLVLDLLGRREIVGGGGLLELVIVGPVVPSSPKAVLCQ